VPSFPEKPWPITARQLLAHLGGIRDYSEGEFASTRHYTSVTEALAVFKDDPLVHEPGTRFLYSTYGYTLLGAAVEGAAGESFLNYLRKNVLEPAGMERTTADDIFAICNRAQAISGTPRGALELGPDRHQQQDPRRWHGRDRGGWRASPSPGTACRWETLGKDDQPPPPPGRPAVRMESSRRPAWRET
jgi:CubicO group peptidase (beta-lactamase class C family)